MSQKRKQDKNLGMPIVNVRKKKALIFVGQEFPRFQEEENVDCILLYAAHALIICQTYFLEANF